MKFILLAILLAVLPDVYIWFSYIHGNNSPWSWLYWLPLTLITLSLVLGFVVGIAPIICMNIFFVLVLGTVLPKLVFTAVSLLGRGVGILVPHASQVANIAGVTLAGVMLLGTIYGFAYGWKKLTVVDVEVASERVPKAFDGYRMVQLSDLHISTFHQSPQTIDRLVEMVNGLDADAIVFTGDLVNLAPDELNPFMDVLSKLRAKDGVFSVMGNHDYCVYGVGNDSTTMLRNTREVISRQEMLGWDLLMNENRLVHRGNDSIAIIGVENDGEPPFPSYANLPKALEGVSDEVYKVLLSHDPTHWRRDVLPDTNIDLTLSGHTHSMQFRLGSFSPSMWTYREWGGTYYEGDRALHVNTGTGGNVPFRLGAWPEITLITLRSK